MQFFAYVRDPTIFFFWKVNIEIGATYLLSTLRMVEPSENLLIELFALNSRLFEGDFKISNQM